MTARFCVAIFYGVSAVLVTLFLQIQSADVGRPPAAAALQMPEDEVVFERTGHPEIDDLPAYLSEAPRDASPADIPAHFSSVERAPGARGLAIAPGFHWIGPVLLGLLGLAVSALIRRPERS